MALPQFFNPRNPVLWITGLATTGVVVIGTTTYNAFFGEAATILEEYTVAVEAEALQVQVDASGTIVPVRSVNISPSDAGQLRQLLVDQGMQVEEGQRLAIMENETVFTQGAQAEARYRQALADGQAAEQRINLEIAQARARLAAANARLAEAQGRLPTEQREANIEVIAAQERVKKAQQRLERYQEPTTRGAISQNDFDDAVLELTNAEAALADAQAGQTREANTARPEIRELSANVGEAQAILAERERTAQAELASRRAAVELAQAQLEEVRVDFQDTIITAPFSGVITQKFATPGAFVTPTTSGSSAASASATSILALADGLEVLAKIPEIDVTQVQPGQFVDIIADAQPNQKFRGRVRLVAPEAIIEENVTSFEVRIVLDPKALEQIPLLPGMNVDVTFLGPQLAQALVVPTVAVVTEEGQTGVMVPDASNKPVFRPVTLGNTIEDKTQVVQGLQVGERVFIDIPEKYRKDENAGRV